MEKQEVEDGELTAEQLEIQQLESTYWQVLRIAYLRGRLHGTGKRPLDLTEDQKLAILGDHSTAMLADLDVLRRIGEQYRQRGVQSVHTTLHGQPGVDNEMLDEAVEFHSQEPDDDEEPTLFFE